MKHNFFKNLSLLCFLAVLVCFSCEKTDLERILKIRNTGFSQLTPGSVSVSFEFIDFGRNPVDQFGICWKLDNIPFVYDNRKVTGKNPSVNGYSETISDLKQNETYFIRAYAISNDSIVYGSNVIILKTPDISLPSVRTATVINITSLTAACGGEVTSDGYGTISVRGVCWSINPFPTIRDSRTIDGTGKGSFNSELKGLISLKRYYVRAYATNEKGTVYGQELNFTTQ